MAQKEALKSAYGQGPEDLPNNNQPINGLDDFVLPNEAVDLGDVDVVAPDAAMRQDAGLPPQSSGTMLDLGTIGQQQVGAQVPEWMGGGIEGGTAYTPEEIDKLIDAGAIGTSIAIGVAFPAANFLKIATAEGLLSYVKDTLKNQYNPEDKELSEPKKFMNAVINGVTAGASQKATQWLLGKLVGDAAKTGDKAIMKIAREVYDENVAENGVKSSILAAEKAGVKLSPAEAFPFDEAAQVETAEALRQHTGIGLMFARRLGQYKNAIKELFADSTQMESTGTIRDVVDETIKSYRSKIGSIQKQLNVAGADLKDIRMDGQSLLNALDDKMKLINGDLADDVLNSVAPEMNTIRNELSNALKVAEAEEFVGGKAGAIVDAAGNAIKKQKGQARLTLNDIEKFRDRISDLTDSAYKKLGAGQQLSRSEEIAKSMYKDVARLRDQMSEQIAEKIGRPELAAEVRSLRSEYTKKIDAWETISDRLSNAPADEIKYLIPKNDAALAGQIMSVMDEPQKAAIRQTFVSRLLDPVYMREAGESVSSNDLSKQAFTTAKRLLKTYDENVLKTMYSPEEISSLRQFLTLGESAESVIARSKAPIEKTSVFKRLIGMVMGPKEKIITESVLNNMSPDNPIKKALEYQLYLAGKRSAGDVSADVAKRLGAPAPTVVESAKAGIERARQKLSDVIPARGKDLMLRGGQAYGRKVRGDIMSPDEGQTE